MCDLCDDPELTAEAYLQRVCDRLMHERFLVQGVRGSARQAEFSYTVGLTSHGLPELLVAGMRSTAAHQLLESWGTYLLDQSLVLPGETLCSGPFAMEAIEVERPEEHLRIAVAIYGPEVRALQLAWADDRGRWPWQPGHRARRAGQPLLGRRAPWYCDEHRTDRLDVPPHL